MKKLYFFTGESIKYTFYFINVFLYFNIFYGENNIIITYDNIYICMIINNQKWSYKRNCIANLKQWMMTTYQNIQ